MDVLLLSRLQFAFTIAFHYIFPPLNIGLGLSGQGEAGVDELLKWRTKKIWV